MTREIVVRPGGAGLDGFAWRVSIADVSADGPFSVFEGIDRVLVILAGHGLELRGPDHQLMRRLDEQFVPFKFRGEDRVTASLVAGPSADFNVMTRRGIADAEVRVVRTSDELESFESGVLFAARGRWMAHSSMHDATDQGAELGFRLDAGDGCWWDEEPGRWRVAPNSLDAVLLAVRIRLLSNASR